MQVVQVETTRFGTIEVNDEEIVVFPDGLPGFRGQRRMVLVGAGDLLGVENGQGHHTLYWLQDVHDPELAFLTTVPWVAYPEYDIDIDSELVADASPDDICVLVMVTIRRDGESARLTTNLLAPIVIDSARRIGQQIILQDSEWPLQAPLAECQPMGAG